VNKMTVEQRLAIRREAALQIDPKKAEVMWQYANVADPYGVYPDCPEECIGRIYFARPSGSDVWVCFADLPAATVKALREKEELRRAFPEPTVYRRAKELLIVSEDQEIRACTYRPSSQAHREDARSPQGTRGRCVIIAHERKEAQRSAQTTHARRSIATKFSPQFDGWLAGKFANARI
jgi:hypothetical protein